MYTLVLKNYQKWMAHSCMVLDVHYMQFQCSNGGSCLCCMMFLLELQKTSIDGPCPKYGGYGDLLMHFGQLVASVSEQNVNSG